MKFQAPDGLTDEQLLEQFASAITPWAASTQLLSNGVMVKSLQTQMGFTAEVELQASVQKDVQGKRELVVQLIARPNPFFWVCLALGFCTIIMFAGVALFFLFDMRESVRNATTRMGLLTAGMPPQFGA